MHSQTKEEQLTQLLASSSKDFRVIPGRIKPLRGGVINSFSKGQNMH